MADLIEPQIGNEGPKVNSATANVPLSGDAANPGSDHEPVNPATNDKLAPGGKFAGQDLTGTQASSTQLEKGDLVEDEWDSQIVKFRPYKTPFLSIARRVAKRVNVQNWKVKHMRVGGDTLEVVTTSNISAGNTIKLTSSNTSGSLRPFYKGTTVIANGVDGYKPGSQSILQGELMLFVVDADKTGVTLQAINGPARTANEITDDLDSRTCPAIPSGTVLSAAASAASESQLMISPENFQPRPKEVILQKKLLNIVFTEDFDKVKRKQPLGFNDIKEDALVKYNIRTERTYMKGVASQFNVQNADGSVEYVRTSEGILNQITNSYAIDSEYTLQDLIALSKLQFTEFSNSDHAYVFCGKDALESLLNINPGTNRTIFFNDYRNLDLDFKRFKTPFGTFDFVHDQTLDMLGMKKCMVILDLNNAVRYVKISEKEQTNDMSKGAGEIRDAKRFIHQEADAIALRGFNSILVGPKDTIFGMKHSENMNEIISSDSFPTSPSNGMLIALTADYTTGGTTYYAGTVYQCTITTSGGTTTTTWSEYTGLVVG